MVNYLQFKSLVKQELRRASRSQYVIFSFIIFPLMMWGIQAGVQSVATSSLDASGEIIYVNNMDVGNSSHILGDILVDQLELLTQDENSPIYQAELDFTAPRGSIDELREYVKSEGISPVVVIPEDFTQLYNEFNQSSNPIVPSVTILSLPDDNFLTLSTQSAINIIVSQEPFTIVSIEKVTAVMQVTISYDGEEGAADPLSGIGFIAFLTILLAVMAPAAFVSSSFAGEKENRTLEALLALPMSRTDIMMGKISAGLFLTILFAIMNIVGIFLFNFIMGDNGIDVSFFQIISISFVLFITAFVAIGFGVVIASFAKDQKTANTLYQMIMLIPTMLVGFTTLFNGVPETFELIYLMPWTHSMAFLMKGIYPQTYSTITLTGSVTLDLILHLGYLLLFVIIFVLLGSKLFNREQIIS